MLKYFLLLNLFFVFDAKSKEELIVVKTSSTDERSFVLGKGVKDGISKNQEVIFSNDNVSIVCKASQISRDYSLWIPVDPNINIPFKKDDLISMNTHAFGNIGVDIGGNSLKLTPEIDFNIEYGKLRKDNSITLRYSYGKALSESSSSVGSDQTGSKTGQDFSFEYGYRYSLPFEFIIGARLDYEIYRLQNPELDIPTERSMLLFGISYHAVSFSKDENNFYVSALLGIGKSTTTIDEEASSGRATLLPLIRFGYLKPLAKSWAIVFEAQVESISANENFSNGNNQETTEINSKASVGIRF
jgi:hypothetical protein